MPAILHTQAGFSQTIAEIYKPISGAISDPETLKIEGNPEGVNACEQYQQVVEELKANLAPELEMIETRIIRPIDDLIEVIRLIRKTAIKRDHKQLDYDRHRATLKKLQEKEKSIKDEKALYQAETNVESSTQEYNSYNDLLKAELPKLFELEKEFIRPLFQSFYYMQLNVFYTLHQRMQNLNIPYFDLTGDIEGAFKEKFGNTQERAEELTIVHFKTSGRKASHIGTKFTKYGKKEGEVTKIGPELGSKPGTLHTEGRDSQPDMTIESADTAPPPSYQTALASSLTPGQLNLGRSSSSAGKPKPPPPKPKPKSLMAQVENATAMYDFEPLIEGDLGFKAGDVIEIVQRTSNENEVSIFWSPKPLAPVLI